MTAPDPFDALDAAAAKATPGPLVLTRYDHGGGRMYLSRPDDLPGGEHRELVADFYDEANREFYAACDPTTIRALVARVRAAEAVVAEAEAIAESCLYYGDRIVQTSAFENGAPRHAGSLALEQIRALIARWREVRG